MTSLREWNHIVTQAAVNALGDEDAGWKPNGYPVPPGKVEAPAVVTYPGGRDFYLSQLPVDRRTFCTHAIRWSLLIVAGPPSEEAWDLLSVFADRILDLGEWVRRDDRLEKADFAGGIPFVEIVSAPINHKIGGNTYLASVAEVAHQIHKPPTK